MAAHGFMLNCMRRAFIVRENGWLASCENKDFLHNAHAIAQSPRKVNQMHWWPPTCCSATSAPISPTPNGWPIRPTFGRQKGGGSLAVVLDLFSRMVVGWSMGALVVCDAGHPRTTHGSGSSPPPGWVTSSHRSWEVLYQ